MKVINFEPLEFESFLKDSINEFNLNNEDKILILGIKDGGIEIGKIVTEFFKENFANDIDLNFVTCQRPFTKNKKKNKSREWLIKKVFTILPTFFLDQLRIIEHQFFTEKKINSSRVLHWDKAINFKDYHYIVIVDDAVDSGYTMNAVVEDIMKKITPNTNLLTMAVVVTRKEPIIKPDYYLYNNLLIRFPWSLDG